MINTTIIIPTKNEFSNLKLILPIVNRINNCDILVIDNSSPDEKKKTEKICKKLSIKMISQLSSGKGNALRESVKHTKNKYIIFFDADCSHNPSDIIRIVKLFNKFPWIDHIGGSRMTGGSDELYNDAGHFIRLFGSIIINILINFKFKSKLTDAQNGFRGLIREKFIKLNTKSIHTSIEMEMVALSLSNNLNYVEIPTHEWKRNFGESKISIFKHSFSYVFTLIKILFFKKRNKKIIYLDEKYWHYF